MAGQPQMLDAAVGLRLQERLEGAPFAEDAVEVVEGAQIVQLPKVEVIGVQAAQRIVEQAQRTIAAALVRLGGEEDLLAAFAEGGAVVIDAAGVGRALDQGVAYCDTAPWAAARSCPQVRSTPSPPRPNSVMARPVLPSVRVGMGIGMGCPFKPQDERSDSWGDRTPRIAALIVGLGELDQVTEMSMVLGLGSVSTPPARVPPSSWTWKVKLSFAVPEGV
jgi:hypothetical protein